jgi:alpha-beta hydrolase superfamily lysophospholipase
LGVGLGGLLVMKFLLQGPPADVARVNSATLISPLFGLSDSSKPSAAKHLATKIIGTFSDSAVYPIQIPDGKLLTNDRKLIAAFNGGDPLIHKVQNARFYLQAKQTSSEVSQEEGKELISINLFPLYFLLAFQIGILS